MLTGLQSRAPKTLTIESLLNDGVLSISEIARINGVSRRRVQLINTRLKTPATPAIAIAPGLSHPGTELKSLGMKTLNIRFTPAVYKALVEATSISNSGSDELNTIEDYAGDVIMTHLQTLGLLRQNARK